MGSKTSRRLVIDASIASASSEREHVAAAQSARFLGVVLEVCHRVVMTAAIAVEWRDHQSRFARLWLRRMQERKKVVKLEEVPEVDRPAVLGTARTAKQEEAMRKDLHLLEAALATDHRIVSLDETARQLFEAAAKPVTSLRTIVWINPVQTSDDAINWLKEGAKDEPARRVYRQK